MLRNHECSQPTMVKLQIAFLENHNVYYMHYKLAHKILRKFKHNHCTPIPNLCISTFKQTVGNTTLCLAVNVLFFVLEARKF